jgi:hypothetical protein
MKSNRTTPAKKQSKTSTKGQQLWKEELKEELRQIFKEVLEENNLKVLKAKREEYFVIRPQAFEAYDPAQYLLPQAK